MQVPRSKNSNSIRKSIAIIEKQGWGMGRVPFPNRCVHFILALSCRLQSYQGSTSIDCSPPSSHSSPLLPGSINSAAHLSNPLVPSVVVESCQNFTQDNIITEMDVDPSVSVTSPKISILENLFDDLECNVDASSPEPPLEDVMEDDVTQKDVKSVHEQVQIIHFVMAIFQAHLSLCRTLRA